MKRRLFLFMASSAGGVWFYADVCLTDNVRQLVRSEASALSRLMLGRTPFSYATVPTDRMHMRVLAAPAVVDRGRRCDHRNPSPVRSVVRHLGGK